MVIPTTHYLTWWAAVIASTVVAFPLMYQSAKTGFPGVTQTTPTAIYIAVDSGDMEMAWLWVGSMIIISFLLLQVIYRKSSQ